MRSDKIKGKVEFPLKGSSKLKAKLWLNSIRSEISKWNPETKLGSLYTIPHPITKEVWDKLATFNPNNIGLWSDSLKPFLGGAREVERLLINALIDLYGGETTTWTGYVTSGATEANIYSAWIGRKYLEKYVSKEKICLVKSSLTHYSISKASDILGVPFFTSPVNVKSWSLSANNIEDFAKSLYKKSFRGILLPLTIGYTQTGTSDDYIEIIRVAKRLEKRLKIKFFVWIDAALNGLVEPFVGRNFKPLRLKGLQTFLIDFHKFGFVPAPAGVVLFKKSLKRLIERQIPYLGEKDLTLSGTRNGVVAVNCWAVIKILGQEGFTEVVKNCLRKKQLLMAELKNLDNVVEIVTDKNSVSLALLFNKSLGLPEEFSKKYDVRIFRQKLKYKNGIKTFYLSKIFVMPHITERAIIEFADELGKVLRKSP